MPAAFGEHSLYKDGEDTSSTDDTPRLQAAECFPLPVHFPESRLQATFVME